MYHGRMLPHTPSPARRPPLRLVASLALLTLLSPCTTSCSPPDVDSWHRRLVYYNDRSDPDGLAWDAIAAAAAADPDHIEVLADRAASAPPPEQIRTAKLLGTLSYLAVTEKQNPPAAYLAIATELERMRLPQVNLPLLEMYMYFPIESVADRLLSIVADESQTPRTRLMAIRSIRLSKHNWPDSPHPETLGPMLRTLVDTSPDARIVLASLWAEATLGTLDAATLDATLPRLIAADPSLESDDRVEAIRELVTK